MSSTNVMFCAVTAFTVSLALPVIATNPLATEPKKRTKAVNYGRLCEPLTRPAFIPLPPGEIEPRGWLRDWCKQHPVHVVARPE